ncbi:MAG: response regulator, partial [Erysipelotrichaceae bacterium]
MQNILVVEDEKMIRKGIVAMIQRANVPVGQIYECKNGEEALALLQEVPIDVMFTDIKMPKMDGIALVSAIQKLEQPPIVVVISGYDDFSYAVEMLRNGVREYLLKPVERERLYGVMQQIEAEL